MLRLILRLRPSSGLRCPRALPAGPAALSSRSAPGTSCLRRLHYGAGSRAASLDSGFSYRATLLRSPQLASGCQCKRFYSLPPHQKVTLPEPVSGCYSTHVHRVSWFDLPACSWFCLLAGNPALPCMRLAGTVERLVSPLFTGDTVVTVCAAVLLNDTNPSNLTCVPQTRRP